jgi:hypothetical protein
MRLGTSKLLDSAIMALSATYNTSLSVYSLQRYVDAVKSVRTQLARMDAREDILYVTAILQTYEVIIDSWWTERLCKVNAYVSYVDFHAFSQRADWMGCARTRMQCYAFR